MCVSFQFIQWLTQLKIVIGISVSGEGNFAKQKIFWYFTKNGDGVPLTKLFTYHYRLLPPLPLPSPPCPTHPPTHASRFLAAAQPSFQLHPQPAELAPIFIKQLSPS